MNYTAGPWKVTKIGPEWDIVTDDNSKPVRVVGTGLKLRDDGIGTCLFNAQLIAAAPDLLENLENSVTEMQELIIEIKALRPGSYRADTTIRKAKEAIAKAKGL